MDGSSSNWTIILGSNASQVSLTGFSMLQPAKTVKKANFVFPERQVESYVEENSYHTSSKGAALPWTTDIGSCLGILIRETNRKSFGLIHYANSEGCKAVKHCAKQLMKKGDLSFDVFLIGGELRTAFLRKGQIMSLLDEVAKKHRCTVQLGSAVLPTFGEHFLEGSKTFDAVYSGILQAGFDGDGNPYALFEVGSRTFDGPWKGQTVTCSHSKLTSDL